MTDSNPYKHYRQCGNRVSNDKLNDHQRQCKTNDAQKVYDSFDFKSKKQGVTTRTVEDNDRVKEMKETIEVKEESPAGKEQASNQSNGNKVGGPSPTQKTERKSSGSSSNGSKKEGNASSPNSEKDANHNSPEGRKGIKKKASLQQENNTQSGETSHTQKSEQKPSKSLPSDSDKSSEKGSTASQKKVDPITGKEKLHQAQDKDNQDNKPFPNPRNESSITNRKNVAPISEKNDLKLREKEDTRLLQSPRKSDKSSEKEIYPNTTGVPKDNTDKDGSASEEDKSTKAGHKVPCKYCGKKLPTEEMPTHERLCKERPLKTHEMEVKKP